MRRLALLLLVGCAAPQVRPPPPAQPPPPVQAPPPAPVKRPANVVEDNAAIEYRAQAEGKTLIEVTSPAGSRVDIREGQALIGRDAAPMAVKAESDHWYTVSARLPGGEAREIKV